MGKNRSNDDWMRELRATAEVQSAALADLRAYLLRAALYSLSRNRDGLAHLNRAEIEQLAEDTAQDALLAILKHLDEFRSESKFTTWAYKFAINFALVAARREQWKRVSLDQFLDADLPNSPIQDDPAAPDPHRAALQSEIWQALREVIDRDLTERQRQVLRALVFDDVPLDEIARHWGSNRNATYKLMHDARRKLKAHLEARGFSLQDILDVFAKP